MPSRLVWYQILSSLHIIHKLIFLTLSVINQLLTNKHNLKPIHYSVVKYIIWNCFWRQYIWNLNCKFPWWHLSCMFEKLIVYVIVLLVLVLACCDVLKVTFYYVIREQQFNYSLLPLVSIITINCQLPASFILILIRGGKLLPLYEQKNSYLSRSPKDET